MTVEILTGDAAKVLPTLPADSFHCCITSPPYFNLRDYGESDQLGQEREPLEYVTRLVAILREVRRVLRDDGTLWLNLGDSYAGTSGGGQGQKSPVAKRAAARGKVRARGAPIVGAKPKELVGIPWRVAFALQSDGWYLRQDIVWVKPNPMPESVRDRCTKAHEYLFLLSKRPRYYFDADAIAEPVAASTIARTSQPSGSDRVSGPPRIGGSKYGAASDPETRTKSGNEYQGQPVRNRRSWWAITTQPFREAHFATFPPALVEPCILAGSPEGGTVLDPFAGAGTTGLVASRLHRNAVLVELNPEYVDMARRRIEADAPLLAELKP